MTRSYFEEHVDDWCELVDLCNDHGFNICDNIYTEDDMDERIEEYLSDVVSNQHWWEIRDRLNEIPSGADRYLYNGEFNFDELDQDDFAAYKDDVFNLMCNGDLWDEEDFEDSSDCEEVSIDDDDDSLIEPADFSVQKLFELCHTSVISAQKECELKELELKQKFTSAINAFNLARS